MRIKFHRAKFRKLEYGKVSCVAFSFSSLCILCLMSKENTKMFMYTIRKREEISQQTTCNCYPLDYHDALLPLQCLVVDLFHTVFLFYNDTLYFLQLSKLPKISLRSLVSVLNI